LQAACTGLLGLFHAVGDPVPVFCIEPWLPSKYGTIVFGLCFSQKIEAGHGQSTTPLNNF